MNICKGCGKPAEAAISATRETVWVCEACQRLQEALQLIVRLQTQRDILAQTLRVYASRDPWERPYEGSGTFDRFMPSGDGWMMAKDALREAGMEEA